MGDHNNGVKGKTIGEYVAEREVRHHKLSYNREAKL